MFKLHIDNDSKIGINKTNGALSADEKINLCNMNSFKEKVSNPSATKEYFSLEDLFNTDIHELENRVYELIIPIESNVDKP